MAHGQMLLKANEEKGEAGLAARSVPQIEATSILAPGNADACDPGRQGSLVVRALY